MAVNDLVNWLASAKQTAGRISEKLNTPEDLARGQRERQRKIAADQAALAALKASQATKKKAARKAPAAPPPKPWWKMNLYDLFR